MTNLEWHSPEQHQAQREQDHRPDASNDRWFVVAVALMGFVAGFLLHRFL